LAAHSGADDGLDALLARADRALYAAKANGRDRVEIAA
jgi:PleD family two-component response regulator